MSPLKGFSWTGSVPYSASGIAPSVQSDRFAGTIDDCFFLEAYRIFLMKVASLAMFFPVGAFESPYLLEIQGCSVRECG